MSSTALGIIVGLLVVVILVCMANIDDAYGEWLDGEAERQERERMDDAMDDNDGVLDRIMRWFDRDG